MNRGLKNKYIFNFLITIFSTYMGLFLSDLFISNLIKNDFNSKINYKTKNYVKKPSTKFEKTSISIDEHHYDLPEDLDPLSVISSDHLKTELDTFISSMPEKLKTAFVLREYEGKSYEEIASITNCPIGTIRSRIFRAREEIVNYFKEVLHERD